MIGKTSSLYFIFERYLIMPDVKDMHFLLITRFPLKGDPKVKEVLAKNVPYAREAPKINFDRVFHTKAKTRSKLILEASRPGPLSP